MDDDLDTMLLEVLVTSVPATSPHLIDRSTKIVVELLAPDMALVDCDIRRLANGANRARIGKEIMQFGKATALGNGSWRIEQLLRGRGGTENEIGLHEVGSRFVLLDDRLTVLPPSILANPAPIAIVALGNADPEPVAAPFEAEGLTLRPLAPVHGTATKQPDGSLLLRWTRRARGSWQWLNGVETPFNENAEVYEISTRTAHGAIAAWETKAPELEIAAETAATIPTGQPIEIRQRGRISVSLPLSLILSDT